MQIRFVVVPARLAIIEFTMKSSPQFAGFLALLLAGSIIAYSAQTQQPAQPQPSGDIPTTDAQSGACSIELTALDADAKPVYAARIDYHAAYGFMGTHKLDMAVYTNAQGKARFTGIPAKVKNPPIEFRASKGDLSGIATMNPATECQARHDIVMAKTGH
jgi:hypothetical protein